MTYFHTTEDYLSFYKINKKMLKSYSQEIMNENDAAIAIHLFEPLGVCKDTVLFIHGYFDHTGGLKNLINFFLAKRIRVVSYDLQGHGLSSGVRGEITDFHDYTTILQSVLAFCAQKGITPRTVVSHSTGGAICIDYLLRNKGDFDKVILIAPLVRSAKWWYILAGAKIIPLFKKTIIRKFKRNSNDEKYLAFVRKDPLQCRFISIPWVQALIDWNKKVEDYPSSTKEVYVIQGTRDATVDWRYNSLFLQERFQGCQIAVIENGRHQLFNDEKVVKEQVLSLIEKQLNL